MPWNIDAAARLAAIILLAFAPAPGWAQVSGQIAVASDYRFRGISLSNGPALEASLSYDHFTGLFAGAFASNVDVPQSGLGVQAYAGYARRWDDARAWDIGLVGYVYPSSASGNRYDFAEAFAGITLERIGLRLYASNDYYASGNPSLYTESSAGVDLTGWLTLGVHLGILGTWPQDGSGTGAQTRVDGRVGLTAQAAGFTIDLSVVGTDAQGTRCPGRDPSRCDTGLVLTISRGF